jgi:hypothetical protein
MSYRYQLTGVRTNMIANGLAPPEALFKDIDYSTGRLCGLNENALNELFGTYMSSVDWNCNSSLQNPVAQDVNGGNSGWCGSTGNRTNLSDFNEWAVITDPSLTPLAPPEVVSCITFEEWQEVQSQIAGAGTQPALSVESCFGGRNVFIGATIASAGTCTFPYSSVRTAHDLSPNNSVFFFKPGVYDETGVLTLDKPGLYMSNVGTAEVR